MHDRLVHRAAAEAQRPGAHHVTARQHRCLGVPAADVHDEGTGPGGEVEARASGGRDRLVDEPNRAARPQRPDRRRQRSALHRGGAARHADHGRRPQQATAQAGPAQEGLQHGRRRVQVGDDPATHRVDDLDVLRFLPGQRVRGGTHGRDAAGRPVNGDGRRLLDDQAAARHGHERVDSAQVNRYACPQSHGTCPLPGMPIRRPPVWCPAPAAVPPS